MASGIRFEEISNGISKTFPKFANILNLEIKYLKKTKVVVFLNLITLKTHLETGV